MSTMSGGPNVVTNGLILYLDAANIKSFRGVPTTNLLADGSLFIYNNVPAHVTATLTQTSDRYRGVPIWRQTLTPTTATGVSYLTAGNNPGIGVYSNSGGGTANRYTGFSIFFKPTVLMHSSPIYTHYSNIPGWQTQTNYDDMGDGWYRAHVIWYDTVTRSDGKFWAINPLTAVLNTAIEILWAGPFKEDRNDSSFVSQFVNGTRGATVSTGGGWADRTKQLNDAEFVNAPSFNSNNQGGVVFNGSDTQAIIPENSIFNTQTPSVEVWVKTNNTTQNGFWFEKGNVNTQYSLFQEGSNITWRHTTNVASLTAPAASYMTTTKYAQVVGTYTAGDRRIYVNGVQVASDTLNYTIPTNANGCSIGVYGGYNGARGYYYNGNISIVRVYNRNLSATEVLQNYNTTKTRFGLS